MSLKTGTLIPSQGDDKFIWKKKEEEMKWMKESDLTILV